MPTIRVILQKRREKRNRLNLIFTFYYLSSFGAHSTCNVNWAKKQIYSLPIIVCVRGWMKTLFLNLCFYISNKKSLKYIHTYMIIAASKGEKNRKKKKELPSSGFEPSTFRSTAKCVYRLLHFSHIFFIYTELVGKSQKQQPQKQNERE